MQQSQFNQSYTERIIYSRQYRSLQDKTQLFYPSQKLRVRTRLTHTLEVRTIAHKIGCLLNRQIQAHHAAETTMAQADLELIDAIAFAHDIGHTPFGHIGERTIDAVVSGTDSLGGLVHHSGSSMRFKHNSNALRILVDLGINDWRVTEGALSHTRVYYKKDGTQYQRDPYNPFANAPYRKLTGFIFSENELNFRDEQKGNPPSLTLEGQIVAIADEIAQRAADIGDAKIRARYLDSIEKKFKKYLIGKNCPKVSKEDPYFRIEWIILTTMTEDVVAETFKRLQQQAPAWGEYGGIVHGVYHRKVASFSDDMEKLNDELDDLVSSLLAQSEEVRESDSRARYIIRQLYKAYVNDVTLLPDLFIENHLNRISNRDELAAAIKSPKTTRANNAADILKQISKKDWYVRSSILPNGHRKILDMRTAAKYFDILKGNNEDARKNSGDQNITTLFESLLLDIGFYIAGMTNTEAFDAYNKIYGHTL